MVIYVAKNMVLYIVVKNPPANAGDLRDSGSIPWSGRDTGEEMATRSSVLGESQGQRNLVAYSP